MRIFDQSFFKIFTFSLPIFCLFLSLASSAATPPPPSAVAASETLRARGYSLFAGIIAATDTALWNGTGTILAPPDFAFSFATAKFTATRRAPPRPSTSLLLYHTLKQPLNYHNLTGIPNPGELVTFYQNYCVFVSKNGNGELTFAETRKPIAAVKIRQPDLYVDDRLTVHGVDGVMDPASASKCASPDLTVEVKSEVDRSFLDHAVKVLRRRGFGVVATAMEMRRSDLMSLTAVTVLAPSDARLFSESDGFRFDFRHHVIAKRLDSSDLGTFSVGTQIKTVAPNKTVVIGSVDGAVTVDGAMIDGSVIYHNRWVTVISISRSLDDVGQSAGVLAPAPTHSGDSEVEGVVPDGSSDSESTVVQSPAPSFSDENPVSNQFPGEDNLTEIIRRPPSPSPAESVSTDLDFLARNLSRGKPASRQFPGGSTIFGRVRTPSPAPNHHVEAKGDVGKKAVTNDTRRHPPPSPVESASTHSNSSAPRFSGKKPVSNQFSGRVGTPSPAPNHHGEAKGHVGKDAVTNDRRRHGSPSPVESASTHLNSPAPSFSGGNPVNSHFSGGFSHSGSVRTPSPAPNHHGEAKGNVGEHAVTKNPRLPPSPSPVESASTDLDSPAPSFSGGPSDFRHVGTPSPAPIHNSKAKWDVVENAVTNDTLPPPSLSPDESDSNDLNSLPASSPACSDGVVSSLSLKGEGEEDLFCPLTVPTKVKSGADVAQSSPFVTNDYSTE